MSRSYEYKVMVRAYKPERVGAISTALQAQWDFDPSEFPLEDEAPPAELDVTGVDNLTGGMSADDMARGLAQAVWAANGAYCEVEVWSRFLDMVPPSDTHTWTAGDYEAWLREGGPQADERDD